MSQEFTREQVAEHNKETDCWVVINNQVLDLTEFLGEHPGGKKAIAIWAGRDASEEYNMLHKPQYIQKYYPEGIKGKIQGGEVPKEQLPRAKL